MKNTETTAQASLLPRRQGISYAVVALIFAVGSGAIAFGILGDLQGNLGSMTGSERLEVLDVNAYTQGDRLVITGNVKNLGSSGMSSIVIDEISAGGLTITQTADIEDGQIVSGHGALTLNGLQHDNMPIAGKQADHDDDLGTIASLTASGELCFGPDHPDNGFIINQTGATANCVATVILTGLSINEAPGQLEPLAAGASKSFRVVITGLSSGTTAGVIDVLRTVPASTDLFVSLIGTDGTTTTISDPRSTRVTQR